jgi:hypothetical protein
LMVHIFTFAFSVLTVEIIKFFKLLDKFQTCIRKINKISRTVLSKKISDHWKEKTLLKYSQLLFSSSFQVIGILLAIIVLYFVIAYFYEPFSVHLISLIGLLESTVFVAAYLYVRRFIHAGL